MKNIEQFSLPSHKETLKEDSNQPEEVTDIIESEVEEVDVEDMGEIKQETSKKFIDIFESKLNKPNPIYSKERALETPEIMHSILISSLKDVCNDPNIDSVSADKIKKLLSDLEFNDSMSKPMPGGGKSLDTFTRPVQEGLKSRLFAELKNIFPDEVLDIIEGAQIE